MLMRSSWCDFSGSGIAVPAGKDQDGGPSTFMTLLCCSVGGKKFAGYCSWSYHAFFMQKSSKSKMVWFVLAVKY